jgi:hypothetical protein
MLQREGTSAQIAPFAKLTVRAICAMGSWTAGSARATIGR